MAHRIEVALKNGFEDALGAKIADRIRKHLSIPVSTVKIIDVFTVDAESVAAADLEQAGREVLCDPVIQTASLDGKLAHDARWILEVGFRPGVTDNVGRTARESIELFLDRPHDKPCAVYSSRQYLLDGELARDDVERIAKELVANPLIQTWRIASGVGFDGFEPRVPRVRMETQRDCEKIDLEISDQELLDLSKTRLLALSLTELHAVRDYFKSEQVLAKRKQLGLDSRPTDVELECLAQSWSEHCKHKIFNAHIEYRDEADRETIIESLFSTFIRGATEQVRHLKGSRDTCVTVFEDNAGVVSFDGQWNLTFKVETHNSPSALDPYGGALTGIVGVNRDPMGTGLGAELVFNTDVFCFAPPDWTESLPPRLHHPRRVLDGVREGVEHGGNKSGIPTVNGSVLFDERYLGKPLVYCGTGGIMPKKLNGQPSHLKRILPGDRVVMVGGRVGKDGIHGATFSSQELDESSPASAVQIGDPITQKRMSDLLLRLRDAGLYRTITDNGAGGLSSSVGETALFSGGAEIDLSLVPLKYEGLASWEILVSESQERMTIAVPPENLDEVEALGKKMGVEISNIGVYTDSGAFVVRDGETVIAHLDLDLLDKGVPKLELHARWAPPLQVEADDLDCPDLAEALLRVLGHPNVCSKEYFVRQYDHEVQGGSVIKPLVGANNDGPSDAAVLRPRLDSNRAIAVSHGICPRYGDLDTFHMAQCALDEAIRGAVSVGADPAQMWALDNFCWPDPVTSEKNPDGDYKLAQLVRACSGLYEACVAYRVPLISGKDSMKNDYRAGDRTISIPPTLLISIMGIVPEDARAVSMDAKNPGDRVYMIGTTFSDLGRSELCGMLSSDKGLVPRVRDLKKSAANYAALHHAIREGLVESCHDCSDGGLAVCLAETAFAGNFGLEARLSDLPRDSVSSNEALLFSETPGRIVATVAPRNIERFEQILGENAAAIGQITERTALHIEGLDSTTIIELDCEDLKTAWQAPMQW